MCFDRFHRWLFEVDLLNVGDVPITARIKTRHLWIYGMYEMDARAFFVNPDTIPNIFDCEETEDDAIALECLTWVVHNIVYKPDISITNQSEFWMLPWETLHLKSGDCEDGAILLANMILAKGVPYWKVRLVVGFTSDRKSHSYVIYYCAKTSTWVALDWCFRPALANIETRRDFTEEKIYGDVLFSFNAKQAYADLEELWSKP